MTEPAQQTGLCSLENSGHPHDMGGNEFEGISFCRWMKVQAWKE